MIIIRDPSPSSSVTTTVIAADNRLDWITDINPSGVLDIQCAPYQLLTGAAQEFMIGDILLNLARPWLSIYFTVGTKTYSEKDIPSEHGRSYQIEVSGFFPGDSAQMRGRLEAMDQHRWILMVQDNAGIRRQVGIGKEAMDFISDFQNEGAMAGDRGYRFQWSGILGRRPGVVT